MLVIKDQITKARATFQARIYTADVRWRVQGQLSSSMSLKGNFALLFHSRRASGDSRPPLPLDSIQFSGGYVCQGCAPRTWPIPPYPHTPLAARPQSIPPYIPSYSRYVTVTPDR